MEMSAPAVRASRLGNGTEVVDQVRLSHTNTRVLDAESVVGLVGNKFDLQLRLRIEDGGIGQRLVADLIESITRVGDQLAKEDFLVGVKGVDNCE
jgi:hypothetical protein